MSSCPCGGPASNELRNQLTQARNELNNLRKMIYGLRVQHKKDISRLENTVHLGKIQVPDGLTNTSKELEKEKTLPSTLFMKWRPIGYIKTWFRHKNGTPRQGSITSLSRGMLKIDKEIFTNPQHSLEGIKEYSHVWIFFIFDKNNEDKDGQHFKSKVAPPRLNGERVGVFATRSPHRPNPIGLTLARLEHVEGDCIYLSGLDILDGTPVVDVKPYIPQYDSPQEGPVDKNASEEDNKKTEKMRTTICAVDKVIQESEVPNSSRCLEKSFIKSSDDETIMSDEQVTTATWLHTPPSSQLKVLFNPIAEDQIRKFSTKPEDISYRLEFLKDEKELRSAISSILKEDPRSSYRRQKCSAQLYYVTVDTAHVTAWFDDTTVEVLRVKPVHTNNS